MIRDRSFREKIRDRDRITDHEARDRDRDRIILKLVIAPITGWMDGWRMDQWMDKMDGWMEDGWMDG